MFFPVVAAATTVAADIRATTADSFHFHPSDYVRFLSPREKVLNQMLIVKLYYGHSFCVYLIFNETKSQLNLVYCS